LGEEGLDEGRLALVFPFISAWGLGGVFSIRNSTSSSRLWAGILVNIPSNQLTTAPRLKIERAQHHINDLNRCIERLIANGTIYVSATEYMKRNQIAISAKTKKHIPDSVSLLVGDAVHNLRTALDILIFGMIGDRAKKPENIQFPFAKRAETLVSTMTNRETELAGKKVVAKITEIKPYPGGDELLAGLHILDIQDKHRLLVPTIQQISLTPRDILAVAPTTGIGYGAGYGDKVAIQGTTGTITLPGPPAWGWTKSVLGVPHSVERHIKIKFPPSVSFGGGECFSSRPIVEVLHDIAVRVSDVVDELADAYLSP
jgi:hypothetical protein